MRWSSLTGLETETAEDSRRLFDVYRKIGSGMGRTCVVWIAQLALLASFSDETWAELAREVTIAGTTAGFTLFDPLFLAAFVWAVAPMGSGLYLLWQLKRDAQQSQTTGIAGGES